MRTPKLFGAIVGTVALLGALLTGCISACAADSSATCEPSANTWTAHMKFDWQGISEVEANYTISDNQLKILFPSRFARQYQSRSIKPHIPFQLDVNIFPRDNARISDPHWASCDIWVTDSHGRTLKGLHGDGHVRRRSNFHPQAAECVLSFQTLPGID